MNEMNENDLKPINSLPPFTKFCCTIGNIPSSYLLSLTYEEQLLWFCDYLKNTVIPALNNNAECVKELQKLYVELHNYVKHYFDNLDVQNEINNKLDEMASDGTLERIINQEIFGEINSNITLLSKHNVLFIGDSYGEPNNSWIDQVATRMGLVKNQSYFKLAKGGYGFARFNHQWLDLLKENVNKIPHREWIKEIVICGGLNDTTAANANDVLSSIRLFVNYAIQQFPNAIIKLGCIGWNNDPANAQIRSDVLVKVLQPYKNASQYSKCSYLSGVEYVMHYYGLFGDDFSHPNEVGQIFLANSIYQAIQEGYTEFFTTPTIVRSNGLQFEFKIDANNLMVDFNGTILPAFFGEIIGTGNKTINLGRPAINAPLHVDEFTKFSVTCLFNYGHGIFVVQPAQIYIDGTGSCIFKFYNTNNNYPLEGIAFMYTNSQVCNLLHY